MGGIQTAHCSKKYEALEWCKRIYVDGYETFKFIDLPDMYRNFDLCQSARCAGLILVVRKVRSHGSYANVYRVVRGIMNMKPNGVSDEECFVGVDEWENDPESLFKNNSFIEHIMRRDVN